MTDERKHDDRKPGDDVVISMSEFRSRVRRDRRGAPEAPIADDDRGCPRCFKPSTNSIDTLSIVQINTTVDEAVGALTRRSQGWKYSGLVQLHRLQFAARGYCNGCLTKAALARTRVLMRSPQVRQKPARKRRSTGERTEGRKRTSSPSAARRKVAQR